MPAGNRLSMRSPGGGPTIMQTLEVPNWLLKPENSASVRRNMKSSVIEASPGRMCADGLLSLRHFIRVSIPDFLKKGNRGAHQIWKESAKTGNYFEKSGANRFGFREVEFSDREFMG